MMPPTPWQLDAAETLCRDLAGAHLLVAGPRASLLAPALAPCLPASVRSVWATLVQRATPGDDATIRISLGQDHETGLCVCVLPEEASRHGAPARPERLAKVVRALAAESATPLRVLVAPARSDDALAYVIALCRALPTYSRRTTAPRPEVRVAFAAPATGSLPASGTVAILRDAVARAMYWQDMPCAELHAAAFVELAALRARSAGATQRVIRGDALSAAGLHGIAAVGAAAPHPPALVELHHSGDGTGPRGEHVAWVGKGVVFDSGGLSLKRPAEMRSMKTDMSGAAAVLAAFCAAIELGNPGPLTAVLCIAENAVGPHSLRPDDILTLRSGRTVEIHDTDCEGRLLLADGLAHVVAERAPDVLVDLATLTDAAPIATGHDHAAAICNDEALERRFVAAGRQLGELVHGLPFIPELLRDSLRSEVADLRNAAPGAAAGVSWAAQFIAENLAAHRGPWLHLDIEGVARGRDGRGTGFGVGLLLRAFGYL